MGSPTVGESEAPTKAPIPRNKAKLRACARIDGTQRVGGHVLDGAAHRVGAVVVKRVQRATRCGHHLLPPCVDGRLVLVVDPRRLEAVGNEGVAVSLLAARGEDAPAPRAQGVCCIESAARASERADTWQLRGARRVALSSCEAEVGARSRRSGETLLSFPLLSRCLCRTQSPEVSRLDSVYAVSS